MNNTFSLEKQAKTDDLNADLIMRQYKLDKMAKFLEINSINPKLKQSEIAKELEISTSTIQRYRRKINMLSPYRVSQSSNTRKQKTSNHTQHDLKATSNDLKMTSNDLKTTSKDPVKERGINQKVVTLVVFVLVEKIFLNKLFCRTKCVNL